MSTKRRIPRICFGWHPADDRYANDNGLPGSAGLPASPGPTIRDQFELFNQTRNHGYMVIGEAAMRLFRCERDASAAVSIRRQLARQRPDSLARSLDTRFDVLVLPMAYEIAQDASFDALVEFLDHLTIPFVTLGLGIHCDPDDDLTEFDASVGTMLHLVNRKAALFGVRGDATASWLHRHGFEAAVPIGCPSLHLFPRNILSLQSPELDRSSPIATGGYLLRDTARAGRHCELFRGLRSSYVLQDELFEKGAINWDVPVIDNASSTVDRQTVSDAVERHVGKAPPFSRYLYFHHLDPWRFACATHAAFVGDRFHGGVVALQTGVPTVLFTRDVRAKELTGFYSLPTMDLDAIAPERFLEAVRETLRPESLERFVSTWSSRHTAFVDALGEAGLEVDISLATGAPATQPDGITASNAGGS